MSGTPKHGLSYTPEYRCWQAMRLRCHEPGHHAFKDYGARGIEVCPEWRDNPARFLADMGRKPSPKHELDRIDNNRGYSPENCRWVTRDLNSRNRRSNRWIEFMGERKTLIEWSICMGVSADTITKRLDAGWSPEQALNTPTRPKSPNGKAKPKHSPCALCGKPATKSRCRTCSNKSRAAHLTQRADVGHVMREAA